MTEYYTHINRGVIDSNRKHQKNDPPIVSKKGKSGKGKYGKTVIFRDENGNEVARIAYDPVKPILPCGARVVIISKFEPEVIEE